MSELEHIRDQLWRSLEGEAWHGPALLEALSGVDAAAAAARPVAEAHTIWEIVLHLTATVELVEARLGGEPRRLSPEEDWPAPPAAGDEAAWQAAVARLREAHGRLLDELTHRDDVELDAPIVPGFSSLYVTLHGLGRVNTNRGKLWAWRSLKPSTGRLPNVFRFSEETSAWRICRCSMRSCTWLSTAANGGACQSALVTGIRSTLA